VTGYFSIPSPFRTEWGTLFLLEPPTADADQLRQQLLDESYDKPFVVDDGSVRYLYFNVRLMQSAMRIKAPHDLELRYTQQMMACLLFCPRPRRALLIGLGGGSLAKFCYRHLPNTQVTAIEIDPHIIAWRHAFLLPADDERLQIIQGDGRDYLAQTSKGTDLLLVDAFDGCGLAPGFSDTAFLETAHTKLSDKGILVINLAGEREIYADLICAAQTVFDQQVIILSVPEDGNHILFAFRDAAYEPRWRGLHNLARELRATHGLDFPGFAQKIEQAAKRGLPSFF